MSFAWTDSDTDLLCDRRSRELQDPPHQLHYHDGRNVPRSKRFVRYVVSGMLSHAVASLGNMYSIQNISDRPAKLFFAQARKMPELEDVDTERPSTSRSPSKERRSESVKRAMSEMNGTAAKAASKPGRAASRA